MGGGRLLEVPTVGLGLGKFWCFEWVVAYGRWSLTRGSNCRAWTGGVLVFWIGGRLQEVVAHGGYTVVVINCFTGQVKSSRS